MRPPERLGAVSGGDCTRVRCQGPSRKREVRPRVILIGLVQEAVREACGHPSDDGHLLHIKSTPILPRNLADFCSGSVKLVLYSGKLVLHTRAAPREDARQ